MGQPDKREKDLISQIMESGNFAIISESNGKMIRDVGEGIEIYERATDSFPFKVYSDLDKAINYFLK